MLFNTNVQKMYRFSNYKNSEILLSKQTINIKLQFLMLLHIVRGETVRYIAYKVDASSSVVDKEASWE